MKFYFVKAKHLDLAEFVSLSLGFDYDTEKGSIEFEIMDYFFDISDKYKY